MAYFDIDSLDAPRIYKVLASTVVPRPIAWAVTRSREGRVNAAPFSLFGYFGGMPPVLALGIGSHSDRSKDTYANIVESGEVSISVVTSELLHQMNVTAIGFPAVISEVDAAGIELTPNRKIATPRIAASPVTLECRTWKVLSLDEANSLVLVQVVAAHVSDEAVVDAERGEIDGSALDVVGRLQSPGWYARTSDIFASPRA